MSAETIDLLTSSAFILPVIIGVAAAGVTAVWAVGWTDAEGPSPIAGIALAGAFLLARPEGLDAWLVVGVVAVGVAGILPRAAVWRVLLTIPGTLLLAAGVDPPSTWLRVIIIVSIPTLAAFVSDFDVRYREGALGPGVFALSTVGVFFAVPDTEQAVVLMGVALPFVFLTFPKPVASLGVPGSFAVVAAFVWTVAMGSLGRQRVAVAALVALGLLIVEPLMSWLLRSRQPLARTATVIVLAAQLLVVFLASRVAAPRTDLVTIAMFSGVALLTGAALVYVLNSRAP